MRLGLLGGTFDPVHLGHMGVARAAAASGLDAVTLVPARHPPHKEREDIAGPFHRYAMTALATAGEPRLRVSAFEVSRDAPSYTIDTARHFSGKGHEVSLIMGSDSLAELTSWRECHELLQLCRVTVYPRRPLHRREVEERLPAWITEHGRAGRIRWLESQPVDVSSTEIRRRLRSGEAVTGLLPDPVAEYIMKHRLYLDGEEGAAD